jgi:hypothetical protein
LLKQADGGGDWDFAEAPRFVADELPVASTSSEVDLAPILVRDVVPFLKVPAASIAYGGKVQVGRYFIRAVTFYRAYRY